MINLMMECFTPAQCLCKILLLLTYTDRADLDKSVWASALLEKETIADLILHPTPIFIRDSVKAKLGLPTDHISKDGYSHGNNLSGVIQKITSSSERWRSFWFNSGSSELPFQSLFFFLIYIRLTFDHTDCLMPETSGQSGRELKSAMSSATLVPCCSLHPNSCLMSRFIKRTHMHTM